MSSPNSFPSDDAAATRLVIAAKLQGKDAHKLSLELGRAIWEREESFADPAVMASAAQRAGLDAAALRAGGPSDAELDALYEQYTQDALKAGVFGAPSYVLAVGRDLLGPGPAGASGARAEARRITGALHISKTRPGLRM